MGSQPSSCCCWRSGRGGEVHLAQSCPRKPGCGSLSALHVRAEPALPCNTATNLCCSSSAAAASWMFSTQRFLFQPNLSLKNHCCVVEPRCCTCAERRQQSLALRPCIYSRVEPGAGFRASVLLRRCSTSRHCLDVPGQAIGALHPTVHEETERKRSRFLERYSLVKLSFSKLVWICL